jgi:tRNA(Ile)-lysidine synthase
VVGAVRAALATLPAVAAGSSRAMRVAVALSGGRDSMALLDALADCAAVAGIELSAIHIHHGLSPHADAWAQFCAAECARRRVAFVVERVRFARRGGESLEAAARGARYAALAAHDVDYVALAHHADDQAETLLLQLLRGAGPHGLAAMARERRDRGATYLRPLLAVGRAEIEAYVAARGIAFIDDESNADVRFKRNFLRHEIAPRLAAAFPGYPATLSRAAALQADAASLLDELAVQDASAAGVVIGTPAPTLDRAALAALARASDARARNLLRWFVRHHGLPAPSSARLVAMLAQLVAAAPDARVCCRHAGAEIGIHRGRIVVHAPSVPHYEVRWDGGELLSLPHGVLQFSRAGGRGLACAALAGAFVTVRPRAGGESLRIAQDRPRRSLTRLFQDAGVPEWERRSWPLVWCGNALAAAPGIAVATDFQAASDAEGYELHWRPQARGAPGPNSRP